MMNIKVKNAMVIAVSSLFALASCGEVNEGMKNKMVTADFGVASMTVSATTGNGDENVTKGAKYTRSTDATVYASPEKVRLAGTNTFASFFVRIDGAIPDEEVDNGNNWIPQNSALYYPKAENGHGTYVINRQVDATKMGHNLFVVDRYGKTVK
ncbi:MAG: hypothetical protein SPJ13_00050, partial [Bacteroidales bacterium]|nr:hypothetical protein [Bacteroidales bacterium]